MKTNKEQVTHEYQLRAWMLPLETVVAISELNATAIYANKHHISRDSVAVIRVDGVVHPDAQAPTHD